MLLDINTLYDQVLTGVLPYDGSDHQRICNDVQGGVRPSRPTDPSQNQWLQDHVWDMIIAGWHREPKQRCELHVLYPVFFTPDQQEAQNVKTGESKKIPNVETRLRRRGSFLPRIASFFQFLRDSESETQRQVDEMDKAGPTPPRFPYPKANVSCSV